MADNDRKVYIAKYGDRIGVVLDVDHAKAQAQIDRLCRTHGDGGVFLDGRSIADLKDEKAKNEVEHDAVVKGAREAAGLTEEEWSKLSNEDRIKLFTGYVKDEEEKAIRAAGAAPTQSAPEGATTPAAGSEGGAP